MPFTITEATVEMTRHGEISFVYTKDVVGRAETLEEALQAADRYAAISMGGAPIALTRPGKTIIYKPGGNPTKPRTVFLVEDAS